MVIKETRSDKIFNFINYFLLACVFLICLYPLWFIIIASISNPDLVNGGQVWFWPKDISFDGYKSLFADDGVMRGYVNTLIYTTGGTLINLAVTLPAAYALSRRDFVGRKFFTLMFLFTMFFSGGLIPTFLTVKSLGLYNNPWVMVMALFFAVTHWNGYFTAMIYVRDKDWQPLQIVMREILMRSEFNAQMLQQGGDTGVLAAQEQRIAEQIKYALIVVASVPVMCIYPFVQKHFVKGVTVGAVKG